MSCSTIRAAGGKGLAARITEAIGKEHGFSPQVMILSERELERAGGANPFPQANAAPKSLHLYFLEAEPADPDLDALGALAARGERFALKGKVFYLHAPDGIGKSKLAERAERLLGVGATARNWRTVTTLLEMAQQDG